MEITNVFGSSHEKDVKNSLLSDNLNADKSPTNVLSNVIQKRAAGVDDITILQFALTLEHLEAVFYKDAVHKFSEKDFVKAGHSKGVRQRAQVLAEDEAAHVTFLTAALKAAGAKPVKECTYNFDAALQSVDSFLATSRVLEGVGTSAYLEAAKLISNKD